MARAQADEGMRRLKAKARAQGSCIAGWVPFLVTNGRLRLSWGLRMRRRIAQTEANVRFWAMDGWEGELRRWYTFSRRAGQVAILPSFPRSVLC